MATIEIRKMNVIPRLPAGKAGLDRGISWNMSETQEIPACAGMTGRKVMPFNAIVLTVALLFSSSASANILSISSQIEVTPGTQTKVILHYQVDSLPASVDFRIILFDETEISDLTFSTNNKRLEHTLTPTAFPLMSGTLSLDNSSATASITISYNVESLESESKVIPIALLELSPPTAANGVFRAIIKYPDGYELQQSFPSQLWTESELQFSFDMQVIPSLIKATLIPSGSAGLSPTTLIDIFVMISLVGLSYLGWRRLKSQST